MSTTQLARPLKLGQILLERHLVSQQQVEHALAVQKKCGNQKLLGELVVELGYCTAEDVTAALAQAYDVPFARITPRVCDAGLVGVPTIGRALFDREFLEQNTVLPLFDVDGVLTVAVSEPSNVFLLEDIGRRTCRTVQIVAATAGDIRATIAQLDGSAGAMTDLNELLAEAKALAQSEVSTASRTFGDDPGSLTPELSGAGGDEAGDDAPVVKLVNKTLFSAVREGASDIHIEPDEQSLRVRYRVDGALVEKLHPPYAMGPAIVSRIKIMAGLDIAERRLPQDGGMRVTVDGEAINLRVSTLPNKHGEKVVIRVIDNRNVTVRLAAIGLNESDLAKLTRQITKPHGIILVTGPTGSGKSTTLYAILNEINVPEINICTVEDPVEFNLLNVNQFQVREKIGLTFPAVLRSLLRQDPDVIMVGEIRDAETGKTAVQAALTGHLVLSTLHTNDAVSAVTRLQNLGIEPFLVSASLEAVIAQRLVRQICPDCRREQSPTAAQLKLAERAGVRLTRCFSGGGCASCRQRGFKGRTALFELLVPDDEMRDAITSGASLERLRELAVKTGAGSLLADGMERVRTGSTTLEEVLRATTG